MSAPAPRVRRAVLADLPALHALVESAYRGESARVGWTHEADLLGGSRTSLAELTATLAAPGSSVLVAAGEEELLGTVTVADLRHCRAYLGMLAVSPTRQGGGLGRTLIAAAESEAARRFGAAVLEMTVITRRPELIAWYERRGYTRTGELRPFPYATPEIPYATPETAGLRLAVLERRLG